MLVSPGPLEPGVLGFTALDDRGLKGLELGRVGRGERDLFASLSSGWRLVWDLLSDGLSGEGPQ